MSTPALFQALSLAIAEASGEPFAVQSSVAVGGGCINAAYRVRGESAEYFVKLNQARLLPMFEAEAEGLRAIAATATVRAPTPVCCGVGGGQAFLVMEHLDLRGGRGACDRLLGERLAAMHRIVQPYFGWFRDNTIGSTPQPNPRSTDWPAFWAEHRLGLQLRLAAGQGHGGRLQRDGERLIEKIPAFFATHRPQPSLLHGDLWAGNYAADAVGQPVIFDPACYYGDREADIAMTELFGGFGGEFYAAYRASFPLDQGYAVRKNLYNLYHILNHLNLFGGGYRGQAESMLARLLAEARG